jgi:CheY-like chemotaxis protein
MQIHRLTNRLTSTRRARVFIVDDDRLEAERMRRALEETYEATAESDPLTALGELFEGPSYDLVLCDQHMPQVSGLEIFSALSHAMSPMAERFVLMTAHPGALGSAPSFGFRGRVLVKPVTDDELVPFVTAILQAQQSSSGLRAAVTCGDR